MKTKLFKQNSHSQLGKKTQILSVDASLAYLLFALFLFYISNYVVTISKPYSSYISYGELYKNSEALSTEFLTRDVSQNYINSICERNYSNVLNIKANYEFKALTMPGYDEEINNSKIGVHFQRINNELKILFNNNDTVQTDVIILTNEDVQITSSNTEFYDSYSTSKSTDTFTINFLVNNTNEDSDEYLITINSNSLIFLNYYTNDLGNYYVGKTPLYYSCGNERNLAKKTYYSNYAVIEENNIIVNYGVEVWWE